MDSKHPPKDLVGQREHPGVCERPPGGPLQGVDQRGVAGGSRRGAPGAVLQGSSWRTLIGRTYREACLKAHDAQLREEANIATEFPDDLPSQSRCHSLNSHLCSEGGLDPWCCEHLHHLLLLMRGASCKYDAIH